MVKSPQFEQGVLVEHGASTLHRDARWLAYERLTVPKLQVYDTLVAELAIGPTDRVIDIGCAGGSGLLGLRQRFPEASLAGVDIAEELFFLAETLLTQGEHLPIDFQQGNAESLALADNSFDVALSTYVLYYLRNPRRALREMQRVVRPGGQIGIATIAPDNKPWHREFERRAANLLGATEPRVPAALFDSNDLYRMSPRYFQVEKYERVSSAIEVRTSEDLDIYLASLATMWATRSEPYPTPSAWEAAVETVARPVIEGIIGDQGVFRDPVCHAYAVCTNNKAA